VRFSLIIPFIVVGIVPAAAQTPTDEWIFGESGEDIVLEVGGGILTRPEFESSDEYTLRPWPVVDLNFLRLPYLGTFGGGPESGLKFSPSFRIISERDDDDHSELTGLGDVDLAVEVGGNVAYRYGMLRGVFTIRRGFGGHDGFVGETGVDLVTNPVSRLDFSIGPRVHFADSEYLETYLGVTPAQSVASGLPVFDPDGGIKGVGVAAEAKYALTRRWSIVGKAGYERLVGDAADSPITDLGSEDQFTAALGATYRFGLDFFD
jgi:outer membrane protein